jgi:hypothetical protein
VAASSSLALMRRGGPLEGMPDAMPNARDDGGSPDERDGSIDGAGGGGAGGGGVGVGRIATTGVIGASQGATPAMAGTAGARGKRRRRSSGSSGGVCDGRIAVGGGGAVERDELGATVITGIAAGACERVATGS